MIRRAIRFIDERTGSAPLLRKALRYAFPDHWSFLFGEIALYSFVVLIGTGVFLTLFFEPSLARTTYDGVYDPLRGVQMSVAYDSAMRISFDVNGGLLMRQTHHWAALVFVAAISVHLMRIFFTGAFRKPRDLNYYIGLTMLTLALVEGFAGYSMVDDLLSGMGLAIAYATTLSIPVIGGDVGFLIWGGEFPGAADFISRLFIVHVLILPVIIGGADRRPPVVDRATPPRAVPRRRRDRAQRRRHPDVAGLRAALAGVAVRDRRRALRARRPGPDQPDLAVGPVRARRTAPTASNPTGTWVG